MVMVMVMVVVMVMVMGMGVVMVAPSHVSISPTQLTSSTTTRVADLVVSHRRRSSHRMHGGCRLRTPNG